MVNVSAGVMLTVLGHTAPSLSVAGGNNQTVIVGATGINAALNLSNGTMNQSGLASLDVNSLGPNVSGPIGGALVASGSAQSYTAALDTGTLGPQTETFWLNVGDDKTLPGASAPANTSTGVALTVLGHAAPRLSVAGGNNQTVIVGATGINATLNLSNGTMNQNGLASLDVNSLGANLSGPVGGAFGRLWLGSIVHGSLEHRHAWPSGPDLLAQCRRRPGLAGGIGSRKTCRRRQP